MAHDPWGVVDGYFDARDQWTETPTDTRAALLAAMGVDEANPVPPQGDPVRVVRTGDSPPWDPGELRLEDGTKVPVAKRLPPDLPLGYHEFWSDSRQTPQRVIVSPEKCLLPSTATWGWSAQLYATRTQRSWGMGDLADLRQLGRWASSVGAGVLLVNPMFSAGPFEHQEPSPYYPNSRRFLNPLYLDIEDVPGAAELGEDLAGLARAGQDLNRQRRIDRDAVFRLKQAALSQLWARFSGDRAFEAYCREQGRALEEFATYCVLALEHGGDWHQWPAEFQSPGTAAVARYGEAHRREVGFHQWLQWLLDRQLAAAGKEIALVQDVPIGVSPSGADAWVWQDLLARRCTIGAPPDIFNTEGQDWVMPPFIPHRLRAAGYEPIIQTIRAALRRAGGLRIDHVMGLFRLFWIPEGFHPQRGSYVRYRSDELLAILAVESHRSGAFVCGEDLGTVEPQTRESLAAHQVLSFRLLWFERDPPHAYPRQAMAAVTTHDLPTVAGLWTGFDEQARQKIGFPANPAMEELRQHLAGTIGLADAAPMPEVIEATYRALSKAPSLVLLATLEDATGTQERPNMPGTVQQWPNWSQALPGGLEGIQRSDTAARIADVLSRTRSN